MRTAIAIVALAAATACGDGETSTCETIFGPWGGDEMPDLEMHVGDTVQRDLRDHFGPDYCFKLFVDADNGRYWAVRSADPSAVAVSRAGTILETVALEVADSVRVTVDIHPFGDVGAPEPFISKGHEFLVRVRPR